MTIRDITSGELTLFGDIVGRLASLPATADVRASVFGDIMRLVRADFGASYVWQADGTSKDAVNFNMDPANLRRYEAWFQFRDPMTAQLRRHGAATPVDVVIPQAALERTEFFNDFLARDGLHHGINMFLFDGEGRGRRDLGDLRIWRARHRPDFGRREVELLNALSPFLSGALVRMRQGASAALTVRERQVATLVAQGCRDREIAHTLGIGFGTVRTHLNRVLEKLGCANRAELAATMSRADAARSRPTPPH
jgi:DNA-binding CsgD family transcriptional regulator